MADFSALKTAIQTYIKQNGNEGITGEILQEILLSVVTTLGDSAINDLITALANEVAARQNADGTLQQNITNEATARGNADTALGGRIDDEATARANGYTALSDRLGSTITAENTAADQIGAEAETREAADTALQGLIDGITENITNGYVYAGIATPSSTPATGKVFYLALTAGTYTNFGSAEVPQGINILKYNGSAWLLDAFIGIDDELTAGSNNLPKSGNVLENIIKNGSAFDLSAYNAEGGVLATYADLDAALTALNALPAVYKQGGMSFRFVRTSDNKYVGFSLTKDEWSTNVNDWQGTTQDIKQNSQNISDIQSSVMTEEEPDIFYVTDSHGNVIAKIDENGVKAVDYLDKNGVSLVNAIASKVDKIVGKGLSTNDFTDELKDKVENNISEQVIDLHDEFYITDKKGNVAFSVDNSGNVKYNQKNSVQCGNIFSLCDSLGTLGIWQSRAAQLLGMSFDNDINRDSIHPLSVGGTQTNLDEYGALNRAHFLVDYWVGEQHKNVDVLLIENINDCAINMDVLGSNTDKPWMLNQTIVSDNVQESAVAAESYFNLNISSILTGVTKKYGTLVKIPYISGYAKRVTVTSEPTQDGLLILSFSGLRYEINIQNSDTIQEVVEKIAEIDYTAAGYNVLREAGGTSVLLTRFTGNTTLTIYSNTSGVGISTEDTDGVAYNGYAYDGGSLNDSDWLNTSSWKKQYITSQIISRYSLYKGLMDYLTSNLRSTKIYFVIAPRLTAQMNTTYKGDDGLIDYDSFDEDREDYTTCVNMQIEVCKQYGIPVLDMRTESGINVCNSPYFYDPQDGASGVHCGRRGYIRIGETIARLLN